MSEIVIRRYKDDDINGLLEMIKKAFMTPALDKIYDPDVKEFWLSEYNRESIKRESETSNFYVALLDDVIVGSGGVKPDSEMAYIFGVFIDPTIQGKGLGTKIMQALEKDEICQKYKKIYLTAALSAGKFYQKLGYTYKYEVPEIVLDGCLDVVYMEKELE